MAASPGVLLRGGLLAALACLSAPAAAQAGDARIVFPSSASQGALVIGKVPAGSQVEYAGRQLRVSGYGSVVFGIGRDETGPLQVRVTRPDGGSALETIAVTPRDWPTEQVSGVPPKTVNPPPQIAERIKRERAQVTAARVRDDARTDFAQPFIWPVKGRISGRFGSQRIYKGGEAGAYHSGIDIAPGAGAPIVAPADGVVVLAAEQPFSLEGHLLILDHGAGLNSAFLHCATLAVKAGDVVRQGQVIATVGMTGRATGPHLHWSLMWRGARLDPLLFAGPMG